MYREGEEEGEEEEDECIVEWRKMERRGRRRMEGKERSSCVMDGGGVGAVAMEGCRKKKRD